MAWFRSVALAAAVVLMACSGGGQPASQASGAPVTLRIEDFSVEQKAFHQQVAAEYHREHPSVTIQWQEIAQAQYEQQVLPLSFQSHQSPDVFYWSQNGTSALAQLAGQGWVRPLAPDGRVPDDFLKRWPGGSFINGINVRNGKVYGFPFTDNVVWGPGYMYLNRSVFQAAGLDPNRPPTTWSALQGTCAQIKARVSGRYCLAVPMKGVDFQRLWFALAGGIMTDQPFDFKNGHFDYDDPRLLQLFGYVQGLYRAGYVAPGLNDKDFSRQQFAAGQAAIYMDGAWMPSVWAAQGFAGSNYTVFAHPMPDAGMPKGALSRRYSGNVYWVSSQTAHAAAAWDFLQWMTQPAGFYVQNYLKNGFGTLSFADNKRYLTDPAMKAIIKIGEARGFRVLYPEPLLKCPALAQSRAYVDAVTYHPNWEYETWTAALLNNRDVTQAIHDVTAKRQEILTSELQKESAQGLKVSLDCYTFSNWSYDQDFNTASYPKA
jgi:multiple sugar transport system substrate-binding protein